MRNRKDKIFALVAAGCLCLSGLTGCGEIKMSPDNISSKSDDGLMGSVKEETDASDESEADAAGEEDKVSNDMIRDTRTHPLALQLPSRIRIHWKRERISN